jgi:hypothetical protein
LLLQCGKKKAGRWATPPAWAAVEGWFVNL